MVNGSKVLLFRHCADVWPAGLVRLTLPVSQWRRAEPMAPVLLLPPSYALHPLREPLQSGLVALVDRACGADMQPCPERADKGPRLATVFTSPRTLAAVIFDVDGVILASPHEHAWREALRGTTEPARFTTEFYQAHVAGKPRLSGARAALEYLEISDAAERAEAYAERKQRILEELIAAGDFTVFPDALRFAHILAARGIPIAVASSSKNANQMMGLIRIAPDRTLLDLFAVNVCGRDLSHGKPDPEIFLIAATELGVPPAGCLVVEDAPVGIEAARAGGMMALGIARLADEALLRAARADLVVTSLDDGAVDLLIKDLLGERSN